jgi:hypothetical protein
MSPSIGTRRSLLVSVSLRVFCASSCVEDDSLLRRGRELTFTISSAWAGFGRCRRGVQIRQSRAKRSRHDCSTLRVVRAHSHLRLLHPNKGHQDARGEPLALLDVSMNTCNALAYSVPSSPAPRLCLLDTCSGLGLFPCFHTVVVLLRAVDGRWEATQRTD